MKLMITNFSSRIISFHGNEKGMAPCSVKNKKILCLHTSNGLLSLGQERLVN